MQCQSQWHCVAFARSVDRRTIEVSRSTERSASRAPGASGRAATTDTSSSRVRERMIRSCVGGDPPCHTWGEIRLVTPAAIARIVCLSRTVIALIELDRCLNRLNLGISSVSAAAATRGATDGAEVAANANADDDASAPMEMTVDEGADALRRRCTQRNWHEAYGGGGGDGGLAACARTGCRPSCETNRSWGGRPAAQQWFVLVGKATLQSR